MSIEIISIIVLAALIFVSAARRLNDALYLLSIVLFVGGGAAVLLGDPLAAIALTGASLVMSYLSARRDIPTVAWRARGMHASTIAAMATGTAVGFFVTGVSPVAVVAYSVLAAIHWPIAFHAALRVLGESQS